MFISQQYRLGKIQQSVTLWYTCANLIENESLVTSTTKKFSQTMITSAKVLQSNPPVQLNYRLNSSIWETRNHCQNHKRDIFSLLLIIAAMHRGSMVPD